MRSASNSSFRLNYCKVDDSTSDRTLGCRKADTDRRPLRVERVRSPAFIYCDTTMAMSAKRLFICLDNEGMRCPSSG